MEKRRSTRNLVLLSVAFLSHLSSYISLITVQSSTNKALGTIALSINYAVMPLSSLFLAAPLIGRFGARKTVAFGLTPFCLYTAANYYPKPYTLLPSAILTGLSSGLIWPGAIYYITHLPSFDKGSRERNKKVGMFVGIFYTISNLCVMFGGICMTVVMKLEEIENIPLHMNESTIRNATTLLPVTGQTCGVHYSFKHTDSQSNLSPMITRILFSVFLAFNVIAIILGFRLDEQHLEQTSAKLFSENNPSMDADQVLVKTDHQNRLTNDLCSNVKGAFNLLKTDRLALMMILFSLHYGMIQFLVAGLFNAAWITCFLSIRYVSYTTIAYGFCLSLGCYLFGKATYCISNWKMFSLVCLFEFTLLLILLLWNPRKDASEAWGFFLISMGFAICHSSQAGQLAAVYNRFFTDKKSSSALLFVWDPLGSALSFVLTSLTPSFVTVITTMFVCLFGTGLYLFAELMYHRRRKSSCNIGINGQ
ncbi:protein unc-93 homolog A-like [Clavelina lepadiformis]|uniref:protein unc-93 homolog A-like n=1 Tax=Clavelina lepadiformis TaxID=159417 RepID=UPI0040438F85